MSSPISAGRVRSLYEFIKGHHDQHSVQMMCRVLGLAPNGFYAWLCQPVRASGPFGVASICRVMPIAPSTYRRHRQPRADPARRSVRAQRDDTLRVEIQRVYDEHHQGYGPR